MKVFDISEFSEYVQTYILRFMYGEEYIKIDMTEDMQSIARQELLHMGCESDEIIFVKI